MKINSNSKMSNLILPMSDGMSYMIKDSDVSRTREYNISSPECSNKVGKMVIAVSGEGTRCLIIRSDSLTTSHMVTVTLSKCLDKECVFVFKSRLSELFGNLPTGVREFNVSYSPDEGLSVEYSDLNNTPGNERELTALIGDITCYDSKSTVSNDSLKEINDTLAADIKKLEPEETFRLEILEGFYAEKTNIVVKRINETRSRITEKRKKLSDLSDKSDNLKQELNELNVKLEKVSKVHNDLTIQTTSVRDTLASLTSRLNLDKETAVCYESTSDTPEEKEKAASVIKLLAQAEKKLKELVDYRQNGVDLSASTK